MGQNWTIWINEPFIKKYAQGGGFKFYLIIQIIATTHIINTMTQAMWHQKLFEICNAFSLNFTTHITSKLFPTVELKLFNSENL